MQDSTDKEKTSKNFKIEDLTFEEKTRWVGAFTWLFVQDRKQNPALYKIKTKEND